MCMMQQDQLVGPKFCELQHSALPSKSLLETLSECASPPDIHHPSAMLLWCGAQVTNTREVLGKPFLSTHPHHIQSRALC